MPKRGSQMPRPFVLGLKGKLRTAFVAVRTPSPQGMRVTDKQTLQIALEVFKNENQKLVKVRTTRITSTPARALVFPFSVRRRGLAKHGMRIMAVFDFAKRMLLRYGGVCESKCAQDPQSTPLDLEGAVGRTQHAVLTLTLASCLRVGSVTTNRHCRRGASLQLRSWPTGC